MLKAVNNLREQKGFTLIELLIVIAIIGILAAIAIPAFLGQREKARQRALEGSARGSLSELQAALDDYVESKAMVFMATPTQEKCLEADKDGNSTVDVSKYSCANLYSDITDTGFYTELDDIMDQIVTHHNAGKEETSPYDGTSLVTYDNDGTCDNESAFNGKVVICNSTERQGRIMAISEEGAIIYNTPVSVR